jgi:hypothetical protein
LFSRMQDKQIHANVDQEIASKWHQTNQTNELADDNKSTLLLLMIVV